VTDRPVKVVLDASAIVAYTRGSIHVGEVITEVDAEGGGFAVPDAALVEASVVGADWDVLDVLLDHPACVRFPDEVVDWRALAAMRILVGRPDAASAAWLALDADAGLLTAEPGTYADVAGLFVITV
jgi:hypothetical protein